MTFKSSNDCPDFEQLEEGMYMENTKGDKFILQEYNFNNQLKN